MTPAGTGTRDLLPAVLAAVALVLVLAPPESNFFWAVNGLRSSFALAAMAAALLAAALAALTLRPRLEPWIVGALALLLAFPLRERAHLLGDTGLRHRLLDALAEPGATILSTGALARTLHSQPLDALATMAIPAWLARQGIPAATGVAIVGAIALACLHAGLRRALGSAAPIAAALAAAAWTGGLLEAFAGYADGWPVTLAVAAWWWWALDRPHGSSRDALLAAALWLALVLSHRLGWVMLVPMAWRVLAPGRAGDAPRARAWFAGGTLAAVALAIAVASASGGAKLSQDFADLRESLAGPGGLRIVSAWDLANLMALLFPFALLAPALAGREARGAFARSPSAPLFAAALLPLLPMLLLFPVAPHGLGAHRDWDLGVLPALLAALAGARVLSHAEPARARRALLLAVPSLALIAGGWLAVNADARAGERRGHALVDGPGALRGEQASHAHVYLGYRAAGIGDFAASATHFERSARELPNPRHELFAAQAWLAAGEPAKARAAYARALAYEPLPTDVRRTAETVRAMLGAAPPPRP